MPVFIASLNSGSNANCYYIGNQCEAILVDAGLSCRETEKRMKNLGLLMEKVKAIFVSHEHNDHITGVQAISKKYQLPVYITEATLKICKLFLEKHLIRSFKHAKIVDVGGLQITPFRKSHDAADPFSFMVSGNKVNVGVITDIGYACKRAMKYFNQCHAVFLEANYCEDMLMNGSYPAYLKKRISSDEGHLSNNQALELFIKCRSPELQLLILSHLSKNNNNPELVNKMFAPHAGDAKIFIASRYNASPLFEIKNSKHPMLLNSMSKMKKTEGSALNEKQLSLF